jgi:hypothetical protein
MPRSLHVTLSVQERRLARAPRATHLNVRQRLSPMKIQGTKEILQVTNADLSKSKFTDVNLCEAQFTDINLSKAIFTDINFSGAKFNNLNLTNVEIEACDTTGMKIRGVLVSELFAAYEKKG